MMDPETARKSLRPGDLVWTEAHGALRIIQTIPQAFFGWRFVDGEPVTRIVAYDDVAHYRARERTGDTEAWHVLYSPATEGEDRAEWERRLFEGREVEDVDVDLEDYDIDADELIAELDDLEDEDVVECDEEPPGETTADVDQEEA